MQNKSIRFYQREGTFVWELRKWRENYDRKRLMRNEKGIKEVIRNHQNESTGFFFKGK